MKSYEGQRRGFSTYVHVYPDIDYPAVRYRLAHHIKHSPDGFEWGYGGSGPSELARCLLWDYLDEEPSPTTYQEFKFEFIADIQDDDWVITGQEIDKWLANR